MKIFLKVCLFCLLVGNSLAESLRRDIRANFGEDKVIEVNYGSKIAPIVRELLETYNVDHFGTKEENMYFKVSMEVIEELKKKNIEINDVTEDWISHFERNLKNKDFVCRGSSCAENSFEEFYSSFQVLENLHNRAIRLVDESSDSISAKIGSIGKSYEGRDQLTVEIGNGDKPLVFYFCNIHAREWLPPMYCSYMAEMLLTGEAPELLETYDFTILISANPDGYVYSHEVNNLWRKTRSPNTNQCVGKDPNRNYDFFHCGTGTSNDPCSDVYCGPEPFSEIETSNIRDFAYRNMFRLIAMNDVHAKGQLWMYPYGSYRASPEDPDLSKMRECAADVQTAIQETGGNLWAVGPVHSTIYPAAGTAVDWFYAEIGVVYSFTAELRGTTFQPPPSNIIPSNQEVFAGMAASLESIARLEGLTMEKVTLPAFVAFAEEEPCDFLFC